MANELQGKRIAFLVANDGIEQVELTSPWEAVTKAGGTPELIAPERGKAQGRNRTVTSWPSVRTDIRNAGGDWVDRQVQVCTAGPNVLVTSRKPDDLAAFNQQAIKAFQAARQPSGARA